MTDDEINALMSEIQKDERAFTLLTAKMFAEREERFMTYGRMLREFGDPREWQEYKSGGFV